MKTIGNDKRFNIGVDVGGTNVKFGIRDECGNIVSRRKIRTAVEAGPDGILKTIVENLPPLVAGAGASARANLGFSLARPSPNT